jgi:DNA-directed RNA polymerase specialized sigma24 family protein
MQTISYAGIFQLIMDKNMSRAFYYLERNLYRDCYGYIVNRTKGVPVLTRQEIFKDSFSAFCSSIVEGKYVYINDESLMAYFRNGCRIQILDRIKKWIRKRRYERYLNEVIQGVGEDELNNEYNHALNDLIHDKKSRYNIDLVMEDVEDEYYLKLRKVTEILQKLSNKCRNLIHLIFFMDKSHKEIPEYLPGILNENTSKSTLYRCLERIRGEFAIK